MRMLIWGGCAPLVGALGATDVAAQSALTCTLEAATALEISDGQSGWTPVPEDRPLQFEMVREGVGWAVVNQNGMAPTPCWSSDEASTFHCDLGGLALVVANVESRLFMVVEYNDLMHARAGHRVAMGAGHCDATG